MAEVLAPEDMLRMLYVFHSAVEDTIAGWGGTIVKTPGDAVLAVFWRNARGANHATCALRAGLQMLAEMPGLVGAWEERGVKLEVGVGVNSGRVAMGLVGKHHLEPTVIGDPVNVAQRLESMTKDVPYRLVFSESVRVQLGEPVEAVSLDEVTVKGRQEPIRCYGVEGTRTPGA
jgi:class 3 adenylate cyclase